MLYLKFILSAGIIVGASELAKRNLALAALLCALPLTSILTMSWTWVESPDPSRISTLCISILAYTVPSLVLFIFFASLVTNGAKLLASIGLRLPFNGGLLSIMRSFHYEVDRLIAFCDSGKIQRNPL
jgi:hypothetical protein